MASACTNLTGAARLVQLLKIDGYSASKTMGCNKSIKSKWIVDGYDWDIHLYPSTWDFGIGYEYEDTRFRKSRKSKPVVHQWNWKVTMWVALKLVFVGERRGSNVIRATFGCRLVDQSGVLGPSQEQSVSREFNSPGDSSAAVVLIESHDLEGSGYLSGDCLAVECTITVLRELPVPTIPAEGVIPLPPTNLHQHLGELLQSGTGADVTFVVSGEPIAAHKLILASRSPVFMAEFFGAMKEKSSQRIKVKDMDAAAFRSMLHFIYTDTVPELDQEVDAVATMVQHLLATADRYGLDRLKLICEIKLSGGITVDTAATTLALAEQHNSSKLKAKCVEFIVSTPAVFDAVLATEGYKYLEASCPLMLTELLKSVHGRKSVKRCRC